MCPASGERLPSGMRSSSPAGNCGRAEAGQVPPRGRCYGCNRRKRSGALRTSAARPAEAASAPNPEFGMWDLAFGISERPHVGSSPRPRQLPAVGPCCLVIHHIGENGVTCAGIVCSGLVSQWLGQASCRRVSRNQMEVTRESVWTHVHRTGVGDGRGPSARPHIGYRC